MAITKNFVNSTAKFIGLLSLCTGEAQDNLPHKVQKKVSDPMSQAKEKAPGGRFGDMLPIHVHGSILSTFLLIFLF